MTDIYLKTKGNSTSLLLLGDQKQIYLMTSFKTNTEDTLENATLAIKRAYAFIRNVKPLHCTGRIGIYADGVDKYKLRKKLNNDLYITSCGLYHYVMLTGENPYFKMVTNSQIRFAR